MSKERLAARIGRMGKARAIFLGLMILWLPWGIFCFPGNLPWDAGTSIAWFLGIDRSNVNNPWFQNLLMGLFYSFGAQAGVPALGVYLYCWIQMTMEAWLAGKTIAYLSDRAGAGKWAYLLIPLYGLLPVFPIYAFMMGKDSNFALVLMGTVYLLIRAAVEGREFWDRPRNTWTLAMMPAAAGLLRNHAGVIPLAIIAVLILKNRKKAGLLPAGAAALALLTLTVLIPRAAGIPAGEIKEDMSIPLQTTAFYVQEHWDEVTEEEKETISQVVDFSVLDDYHPAIADRIKDQSHFTAESRAKFLEMWLGMIRKHPDTILQGWRWSTWMYFSLTEVSELKSHVLIGVCIDPALQETLGLTPAEEVNAPAKDVWEGSMQIPVVRTLQKIGLYSWLLLGMTLAALVFRRVRRYLPCCLMLLTVLGACLLSPVNGYYRYAYSMILSIPVLLCTVAAGIRIRNII